MENLNRFQESERQHENEAQNNKKALATMICLFVANAFLLLGILGSVIYFGITQNKLIKDINSSIQPPSISDDLNGGDNSSDKNNSGENEKDDQQDDVQVKENYFESYRKDRKTTRDQEMMYYDAIIENQSSSAEAKKTAEEGKLALISLMKNENEIESEVKAQGFEDCVVSISDSQVKVIVQSTALSATDVTKISNIVMNRLNVNLRNIVVFSVE